MKTIVCLMLLAGSFFNIVHAGKITVQGKAAHLTGDSLTIYYEPYKLMQKQQSLTVPVKNGAFSFTLESDVPVRAYFACGYIPVVFHVTVTFPDGRDSSSDVSSRDPRMIFMYLKPGSPLSVQVDVNDIMKTLSFSGAGADDNMFVNKEEWILNSYKEKVLRNYHEPVNFLPDAFVKINRKRNDYKLHFLDSMSAVYKLSPEIKDIYYWKFYTDWVNARLNYPNTHELYTSEKVDLPPGYFDFLKDVKTAETGSNKGTGYFYFLDAVMRKKYEMRADSSLSLDAFIRQNMSGRASYEYLAYSLNKNFKREVLDMFGKNCPYPDIAAIVNDRFKNMKGMLPGSPAPSVALLTADGKVFSFADYKGKYIYVDLWATWCGPCIKEIPSLLKLEKEYHGKNITFLSISFDNDTDEQKWKNYIRDNTVGSIQVRADEKSHRLLISNWNISTIPRFAIIDPQGKIVNASAPFPSSKEIRPALNSLL